MKKNLKSFIVFLLSASAVLAGCKNPNQNQKSSAKDLVIESVKIKDGTEEKTVSYENAAPEVSVTKHVIQAEDVIVSFKGVTAAVPFKINPDRVRPDGKGKKFTIIVETPPAGYNKFTSKEITVKKISSAVKVNSLTIYNANADISKNPIEIRIPKPNIKDRSDIQVSFDKDVSPMNIDYAGIPFAADLTPEESNEFTIKIKEEAGKYKATDIRIKVIFDTPALKITKLQIQDQNGKTDLKNLGVKLLNSKTRVEAGDITVEFGGEYIAADKLSAIVPQFEGLPLENLEELVAKRFKIKVAALDKVYKAFEGEVTVTRQKSLPTLKSLEIKNTPITISASPKTLTVDNMTTLIYPKDIKAVFDLPDGTTGQVLPVELAAGNKAPIYATEITDIEFYVPATDKYAEYRDVVKVTHTTDETHLIKLPMLDGGVTFKTGNEDKQEKTIKGKFELGQYAVTYKLWKDVCTWAKTNGYSNIDGLEDMGENGFYWENDAGDVKGKSRPEGELFYPVTKMTWVAAIVWCNAYSEMKGYAPAYYHKSVKTAEGEVDPAKDAGAISALAFRDHKKYESNKDEYFTAVILTAKEAKQTGKENGFRLPSADEMEYAGKLRKESGKFCAGYPVSIDGVTYYFANYASAAGSEGFGEEYSELQEVAWFKLNSWLTQNTIGIHKIGTRRSTDLGFYDLNGNSETWANVILDSNTNKYVLISCGGHYLSEYANILVGSTNSGEDGNFNQTGLRVARTLD